MSLTGNLEDLPLTDIFQILSLSKRTGILEIVTPNHEKGFILFKNGFIIGAVPPTSLRLNLGEMLIRQGLISETELQNALSSQKMDARGRPLGQILVQLGILDKNQLNALVKQQIYRSIYEMLKINRGTFTFSLNEVIPFDEIRLNPLDIVLLEKGINTQQVLLDALKEQDEEQRDKKADTHASMQDFRTDIDNIEATMDDLESVTGDLMITHQEDIHSTRPLLDHTVLLMVSPESSVRSLISHILAQYQILTVEVERLSEPELRNRLKEWVRSYRIPILVVDYEAWLYRGVPALHLNHLLETLWSDYPELVTILFTISAHKSHIEKFLTRGNVSWMEYWESRSGLSPSVFWNNIVHSIIIKLMEIPHPKTAWASYSGSSLVKQLWKDVGLDAPMEPETQDERFQHALGQLKEALNELRNPSEVPQISLLILQFASEFMDRGILLLNTTEGLIGLGGFGDTGDDEPMPIKVRRIQLQEAMGGFAQVIQEKTSLHEKFSRLPDWLRHFLHFLGRMQPTEIVLFPIIVQNQVVSIYYGDNAVERAPMRDLTYLEIFMNQAGFALENALLSKKLDQVTFR